jgi:nicotinamide phosphoribosyltransferase
MKIMPLLLTDAYKLGHVFQYPEGTTEVYSNFTPRKSRLEGVNHVVFFGLQAALKQLTEIFDEQFFSQNIDDVLVEYRRVVENYVGPLQSYQHIIDLHSHGSLPIEVFAVPEGSKVPIGVPCFTIRNLTPDSFWLPNFLETILSTMIWGPTTSATIAYEYRKLLDRYANETSDNTSFVDWQGHDFSFRGMSSLESACSSGAGHLLSFTGTDTVPSLLWLEKFYNADVSKELVAGSVPATEHSVMCAGEPDGEFDTFKRLITEVYPSGIVSVVSDTWDLWKVLTEFLPVLKTEIMGRDGRLGVRPDSGIPENILCGDPNGKTEAERKGVIELLWDVFGGEVNSKGFKELDSHIGAIYGDSITLERAGIICERLKNKGFASTNIVLGIGSYTYQYVTRDTFSFAIKATNVVVKGVSKAIFKDPVTDNGTKKSAKGFLHVSDDYVLTDNVSFYESCNGLLRKVFYFVPVVDDSLNDIRARVVL